MALVRKIVLAVEEDPTAPGYYCVSEYVTGDPGTTAHNGYYRHLTWTESVDVMLVLFDENRPGMESGGETQQIKLW